MPRVSEEWKTTANNSSLPASKYHQEMQTNEKLCRLNTFCNNQASWKDIETKYSKPSHLETLLASQMKDTKTALIRSKTEFHKSELEDYKYLPIKRKAKFSTSRVNRNKIGVQVRLRETNPERSMNKKEFKWIPLDRMTSVEHKLPEKEVSREEIVELLCIFRQQQQDQYQKQKEQEEMLREQEKRFREQEQQMHNIIRVCLLFARKL